ncbi:MAG: PilT/PilU family type 4a pilus ATPase [Synergistaceae bacterium]|nr:PilT/PilU family type 4a pilus ATPase [Synergistaceae bacterium]MBQ7569458.1 PilT/PilU family type 4a pilus ATPase [Synergistaceae bacterium]MBR0220944.1 PilT/PilU family type 4a pilus ATPase [Synergistaceae bacterium]
MYCFIIVLAINLFNFMTLSELLNHAANLRASDLHLSFNSPAFLRIDGELIKFENLKFDLNKILEELNLNLNNNRELDFSFTSGALRVRGSLYHDINGIAIAFRLLPSKILSLDDLNLPEILKQIAKSKSGLFITAGAAGSGKSTTLAAIINEINNTRREHIITIEDPIEYLHKANLCLIHQREVNLHTQNFAGALKYALRQDPNIIMIGELRDAETISAAVTAAETGHFVLASLHAGGAAQAIERLVASLSSDNNYEARTRIAGVLTGIISQKLIKLNNAQGRVCAAEVCLANNAVRNLIRENKIYNLRTVIQTNLNQGMQTLEKSLNNLIKLNLITRDDALSFADYKSEI